MSCLLFFCLLLFLPFQLNWGYSRGAVNLQDTPYYNIPEDFINPVLQSIASLICRAIHQQNSSINHSGHFSNEKCRLECILPSGNKYRHNLFDGSPCPNLINKSHICRQGSCVLAISDEIIEQEKVLSNN